jgi:GNAT superfamily N-acetyltransferase
MAEIRDATVEDAEPMADVNAAGWRDGYRGIVPQHYLDDLPVSRWLREMKNGLANPRGDAFTRIAEIDGRFVGYCFVAAPGREVPEDSKEAELVAIYVYSQYWGQGAGRALLEAALAETARLGYEEIILWTFARNERALRLYRRTGFVLDGATRPFVPVGTDTVRLRRGLQT